MPEDKEDDESSEDVEDWVDELLGCGLWVTKDLDNGCLEVISQAIVLQFAETSHISDLDIPSDDASCKHDNELHAIRIY